MLNTKLTTLLGLFIFVSIKSSDISATSSDTDRPFSLITGETSSIITEVTEADARKYLDPTNYEQELEILLLNPFVGETLRVKARLGWSILDVLYAAQLDVTSFIVGDFYRVMYGTLQLTKDCNLHQMGIIDGETICITKHPNFNELLVEHLEVMQIEREKLHNFHIMHHAEPFHISEFYRYFHLSTRVLAACEELLKLQSKTGSLQSRLRYCLTDPHFKHVPERISLESRKILGLMLSPIFCEIEDLKLEISKFLEVDPTHLP